MSQGTKRRFKIPENLNNLYASYHGTYAKEYQASYDGTFRGRSTQAGTAFKSRTTREDNNQMGLDPQYD